MKSRITIWVTHAAHVGEKRNACIQGFEQKIEKKEDIW
jgi:hypothetical protein